MRLAWPPWRRREPRREEAHQALEQAHEELEAVRQNHAEELSRLEQAQLVLQTLRSHLHANDFDELLDIRGRKER